jgi:hypothetical protein
VQVYACRGDTGVPLGTWLAHTDAVSAVEGVCGATSAQTMQLLTASWDGSIKLWQCVCCPRLRWCSVCIHR